jgi:simple sugar transport system substrate-binding protein
MMERHRSGAINVTFVVLLAIFLAAFALLVSPATTSAQDPTPEAPVEPEFTFYFVSHIGPADPNMAWLTKSIEEAMKAVPVDVQYVASPSFSIEEQVNMLQTAIAAEPDGLIVPITDPVALEGPLKEAIAAGIPVIASNIADPREAPDKIPYLTYVGGDEHETGVQMANRILQEFDPEVPRRVACGIAHVGHVGAEARCQGLIDVLEPLGVTVDKLALTEEPGTITDVWRSYLEVNSDTDAIWVVTLLATPFVYNVVEDLDMVEQVKIATVDESPLAIEGILSGKLLATHSQQFWLQGYLPVIWLYVNNKFGYMPPPEELVGPVIIDETTAAEWRTRLIGIFGEETYNELSAGWNQ